MHKAQRPVYFSQPHVPFQFNCDWHKMSNYALYPISPSCFSRQVFVEANQCHHLLTKSCKSKLVLSPVFTSLQKKTMKATLALFLVLLGIGLSEAGFRCFFGDWACSSGCKVLGQSSGTCDDDGKCW